MPTYYFDTQDGVAVRDRTGLVFASGGAAIEHSKQVALAMRNERRATNMDLQVIVLDESGREIHREAVYPAAAGR
jgi:hypothetical protein